MDRWGRGPWEGMTMGGWGAVGCLGWLGGPGVRGQLSDGKAGSRLHLHMRVNMATVILPPLGLLWHSATRLAAPHLTRTSMLVLHPGPTIPSPSRPHDQATARNRTAYSASAHLCLCSLALPAPATLFPLVHVPQARSATLTPFPNAPNTPAPFVVRSGSCSPVPPHQTPAGESTRMQRDRLPALPLSPHS